MKQSYVIAPDTDIELLNINLQMDNKNQLTFNSIIEQEAYFNSLPKFTMENSTFQRNDYRIRIPLSFEEAIKYTYCRYKNNEKWYYAFIVDVTYSSNEMTFARLVTDVWQTYQFDITLGVSFIEREHVSNDRIGANLVDEELETGEYIGYESKGTEASYQTYGIILESTRNPKSPRTDVIGGIMNGIPSAVPKWLYFNNESEIKELYNDIQAIADVSEESVNAIKSVYMVSPFCFKSTLAGHGNHLAGITDVNVTDFSLNCDYTKIGTYTPKNNKLLTSPYVVYRVYNNAGESYIYKPELFTVGQTNGSKDFVAKIIGSVTAGGSVRMIPVNYANLVYGSYGANIHGINLGKTPVLNWSTDTYTAWQVNNTLKQDIAYDTAKRKRDVNGLGDLGQVFAQGAGLNLGGALGALDNGSRNYSLATIDIQALESTQMQERNLAELVPNNVGGNTSSGDVTTGAGLMTFTVTRLSLQTEYLQRIDGYFYKFGYRVNKTKRIEINTRSKFNYVKTIGANIFGDVPQAYLESIKTMFNEGVTFWHNPSTFLQYSTSFNDNNIV